MNVTVTVNGTPRMLDVEPRRTLADAVREDLGMTGTHVGCEHGVCGSCTVIVDGEAVRACLLFAVQCDGANVRTVEGLANDGALSALQEAFGRESALQCGFCTPGFLMLAEGYLAGEPDPSEAEVREVLSANLCRCTGYEGLVEAVCATALRRRQER